MRAPGRSNGWALTPRLLSWGAASRAVGQAMPTAEVLVESLFVGPCPAGMQPGESIQEGVAPG